MEFTYLLLPNLLEHCKLLFLLPTQALTFLIVLFASASQNILRLSDQVLSIPNRNK